MGSHTFFVDLFDTSNIVSLGETHHGRHLSVLDNLSTYFVDIELQGLFLEQPVNYQDSINNYVKNGVFDELLLKQIQGAKREGKDITKNFNAIRKLAIKKNIEILCIDSSKKKTSEYENKSKIGKYYLKNNSREEDMFENVINKYKKEKGKWLAIGGFQHHRYGMHFRSGDLTLGSRLKDELMNRYHNICLIHLDKMEDEVKFIKTTDQESLKKFFDQDSLNTLRQEFNSVILHC